MIRQVNLPPPGSSSERTKAWRELLAVLFFVSVIMALSTPAQAQVTTVVEIASGTLDDDKVLGPRWKRLDFNALTTGDHTIRVSWDSNADIRYSLFRARNGDNGKRKIATRNRQSPATWTGPLDTSEEYYLGIWSTSGSANFTATIEAETDQSAPLQIASQPADRSVAVGDNASFTVSATGSGDLAYQWFIITAPTSNRNGGGETIYPPAEIPGETNATLTVNSATIDDDGNMYFVEVSNDDSTVQSRAAQITVTTDEPTTTLAITDQPESQTVNEGDSASFSVNATGDGTLDYQWFLNNGAIPGATNSSYSVSAALANDDGNVYRVDITDNHDTLSSNNATLSVIEITSSETVTNVGQGTIDSDANEGPRWVRVDFDALATATHTVSVSWDSSADVRFNVRRANGTKISPTIQGSNPGVWSGDLDADTQYYIALWSANGIGNYSATIQVEGDGEPTNDQLSIVSQPSNVTVTEGSNATFTVEAVGRGTLNYEWFADGTFLENENSDTLTLNSVSVSDNGTRYSVDVTSGSQTVTSRDALLTVDAIPVADGVTARWMMDEPAGSNVMIDATGNGHDGTIGQDVVTGDDDRDATSYRWLFTTPTGAHEPERIINVPHDSDFNPGSGDYSITMRYRTLVAFGNIIQKGQGGAAGGYWKIENPGGRLTCVFRGVNNSGGWNRKEVVSSLPLNDGDYHTITCERVGTQLRLIVDGVLDDTANNSFGSISNNQPLSIGGKTNCDNVRTSCDYFSGWIDEISISKP